MCWISCRSEQALVFRAEPPTHICRVRRSPGAACGPSWFPPGCTWWRRTGRRSRRSCCRCRRPAGRGRTQWTLLVLLQYRTTKQRNESAFQNNSLSDGQTHVLELALGGGAAAGVLAHTQRSVALVHLAHLPLLAVVVQARVCKIKAQPGLSLLPEEEEE